MALELGLGVPWGLEVCPEPAAETSSGQGADSLWRLGKGRGRFVGALDHETADVGHIKEAIREVEPAGEVSQTQATDRRTGQFGSSFTAVRL
jgi:hypothetical protein